MNPEPAQSVRIPRRFRGPDQSGNGGYSAGLVASAVQADPGTAISVRLSAPPPLDTPLQLHGDAQGAQLTHDGQLIASASVATMPPMQLPISCGWDAAERATGAFVGHQHHPYPGCFVCGPQRNPGDGLRLFAGNAGLESIYAAPWKPDRSLTDADGRIDPKMIWAALDCPSYFSLGRPGLPALLGQITVQIDALPAADEQCVVMAWATGSEGRKHHSASALYGHDGRLLAHAAALWIELKSSPSSQFQ